MHNTFHWGYLRISFPTVPFSHSLPTFAFLFHQCVPVPQHLMRTLLILATSELTKPTSEMSERGITKTITDIYQPSTEILLQGIEFLNFCSCLNNDRTSFIIGHCWTVRKSVSSHDYRSIKILFPILSSPFALLPPKPERKDEEEKRHWTQPIKPARAPKRSLLTPTHSDNVTRKLQLYCMRQ